MMHKKTLLFSSILLLFSSALRADGITESVQQVMQSEHREASNVARDQYRHPAETLAFLGLQPDMTVVEIWPGQGWYTEILAPMTREKGVYFAANFSLSADNTPEYRKGFQKKFMEKLEQNPSVYDHVVVTELDVPERITIAPPGSADIVLTFRNVHNWLKGDYADQMFNIMARALKPNGILGVVEHRAKPGTSVEDMISSGYMTEDYVIALAEKAGFVLEEKSEINANPKDTANHSKGVWTLAPSMRVCKAMDESVEKEACVAEYQTIGESDRMTLRFRKK